jgi:hypothetical protein
LPISDIYPNTPGFVAQIQDFGLKVAQPPQNLTDAVLLLGVATDGPLYTPIQITSIAQAEQIFGITTAAPSITAAPILAKSLTRGVYEAFQAGCTNINLVRVSGTGSSVVITDTVTPANSVTLTANYPGVKYNGLTATVVAPGTGAGSLTITTLDGVAHAFPIPVGGIWGDLMNAVNFSTINVVATQASTSGNPLATINVVNSGPTNFSGGNDGTNLTDAQYNDALVAAYMQLETYGVDVVCPLGAYLQPTYALDASGNPTIANANSGDTVWFGQNLAQFCARVSVDTQSCYGVISVAPLSVPTFTNAVRRGNQLALTKYNFNYLSGYNTNSPAVSNAEVLTTAGAALNIGYLLNICVGPDPILNNQRLGNYVMDGAATYAGKSTTIQPQIGMTNKTLSSVVGLSYNYGASVINTLVGSGPGFVVFNTQQGSVRTVADQTYEVSGGDFAKLSTLRITYASMEAVRQACAGFIGGAANPATINAMGTAVNSALAALKSSGALLDYTWNINATAANQIAGTFQINLQLVPALQIRKIYVTISLTAPGAITQSGSSSQQGGVT